MKTVDYVDQHLTDGVLSFLQPHVVKLVDGFRAAESDLAAERARVKELECRCCVLLNAAVTLTEPLYESGEVTDDKYRAAAAHVLKLADDHEGAAIVMRHQPPCGYLIRDGQTTIGACERALGHAGEHMRGRSSQQAAPAPVEQIACWSCGKMLPADYKRCGRCNQEPDEPPAEPAAPPPVESTETAKALEAIARAATIRLMDKNWSVDECGNEVLLMDHGSFLGRSRIEAERKAAEALPVSMLNYAVSGAAEPAAPEQGGRVTHEEARAQLSLLEYVDFRSYFGVYIAQQEAAESAHASALQAKDAELAELRGQIDAEREDRREALRAWNEAQCKRDREIERLAGLLQLRTHNLEADQSALGEGVSVGSALLRKRIAEKR